MVDHCLEGYQCSEVCQRLEGLARNLRMLGFTGCEEILETYWRPSAIHLNCVRACVQILR
ncbi:hypothetical protein DY000_02058545 [Brassica cretica]|uniref:Uncharacterized protein n=1 Tax=Brassica cretica TaxID=69181 RepID=A0ABQ7AWL9_BRACR|nr:hypothetical protein DY000_02058545 [Brassica cretica]